MDDPKMVGPELFVIAEFDCILKKYTYINIFTIKFALRFNATYHCVLFQMIPNHPDWIHLTQNLSSSQLT